MYKDLEIDARFTRYIQRILKIDIQDDTAVTIPAIPTGYVYIGWIPVGRGSGQANDESFEIKTGQAHITGQLTTFDASYTLHGPCTQYLAKCTADGAYLLLNRDLSTLLNRHEAIEPPITGPICDQTFIDMLDAFLAQASAPNPTISAAARRIEEATGNISIADLAADLGVSERHLRRSFSKMVGVSPKTFGIIRRVLFALEKITANPDMDIADIVFQAGFSDQAHLTNSFKQYLRTTPARLEIDEDSILRTIAEGA